MRLSQYYVLPWVTELDVKAFDPEPCMTENPKGCFWHIRDLRLWSVRGLKLISRSCNFVDPPAEQVSNFQAACKIVILVDEFLVLVL